MQDDIKFLDELVKRYATRRHGVAIYSQELSVLIAKAKAMLVSITDGHKKADAMQDATLVELRKLETETDAKIKSLMADKATAADAVKAQKKLQKSGKQHELESANFRAAQVDAEITAMNKRKNLCRDRAADLEKQIKSRKK